MKWRMRNRSDRRGATLILFALLLVFLIGLIAFAVDIGWVNLTRTELQTAADSSALAASAVLNQDPATIRAVAQHYAGMHRAGGQTVSLSTSDVEMGLWDVSSGSFTPVSSGGNAVRITARRTNAPLFFARVFGRNGFDTSASAVGMANPRDIVFVVDLSGSMNDDSEPAWATYYLTEDLTPQGYPNVANELMQNVYNDFGYGAFPGVLQWVGSPLGVAANSSAYANLTSSTGPLTPGSIPSSYRISSGDGESTRKTKAYRWMIDNQIAVVMPGVKPTPSSANSASFSYWSKYLDYVIQSTSVSGRGTLPPNQDSDRIDGLNNPNSASFPSGSSSVPRGYRNQIGFRTYVQFMMDFGRNVQPDGATYTPLSTLSPDCPRHTEVTDGGTFSFPPREQPTHASRRALIAAIQVIKDRNSNIPDLDQRDWVSIVSFDVTDPGPTIHQSLTGDYDAAMLACTNLQAVGDNQYSTATETGLITANNHLQPSSSGGAGRQHAHKVVVLLTDGMPNLYSSNPATISSYMSANPSSDWYTGSNTNAVNAPIMQAMTMESNGCAVFPVGLGLGTDYGFMDRMARGGGTANDSGESPRGSGNPAEYEQRLADIFEEIITSPKSRLVK
jgi:hypothetical protein